MKEVLGVETQVQETATLIVNTMAEYGLSVVSALVILCIGWMGAKWVSNRVYDLLSKAPKNDETLNRFFKSLIYYAILAFTIIAVLNKFGVQTASLIAVMGAAGLAVGLALQGTLGHVASGVMLLVFRPFKIGDYIEAGGNGGTVDSIGLFMTQLKTPDNVEIIIPNSGVWDGCIKNFSYNDTRRVDFLFGISYTDNIDKAIKLIDGVVTADKRVLKDPAHLIVVSNLGDSSVDLTVRVWVNKEDYWSVKFDTTKAFKEACDKAGISIPFPQRDIHIIEKK